MIYEKELPTGAQIRSLAKTATFPAMRQSFLRAAGSSGAMADFLRLFWEDQIFKDEADFIEKCEELEVLIEEEREARKEILRCNQERSGSYKY